jgi:hypothetical protein
MAITPAIAYLLTRLAEAWDINEADARAAHTPEERAFVTGQRQSLQAFAAWVEIAASGKNSGWRYGKREQ